MSDDDLETCWQDLRKIPVERAISRTMSATVAMERMLTAIGEYSRITKDWEMSGEDGVSKRAEPRLVLTEVVGGLWRAKLEGLPQLLKLEKPTAANTMAKAIQSLFVTVHDGILSHILERREEALRLREGANNLDDESLGLERARSTMGGYEPDQCPLPFPPMTAKVKVRSYVAGKEVVEGEPEDQIERSETAATVNGLFDGLS